ncbi:hypothetical protein AJ79_00213 [Helicocarpus griseus UAMH5409]|uniref:Uncharacterized protein n=1 Tax=Helicocarpus griseus UAMH5409 TaxID=1447875 RepID=A0A2B7YC72_9EURO|nr:hypothetical protein AJ79_00213 [Helicocarpus griseus UAMH5409]
MTTSYSQETTVQAISSFYKFLTNLYLKPSVVQWPPPGGWSTITAESLKPLGKSEIVINLLRPLPYFDQTGGINDPLPARHGRFSITAPKFKSEPYEIVIWPPSNVMTVPKRRFAGSVV